MSLQLVAAVSLDEEVWTGGCTAGGGCLSGLFLVGEVWLVASGTEALLQSTASECEVESVSGCAPGGAVEPLVLSTPVKSTGRWFVGGLGGVRLALAGTKAGGGEVLLLPRSGVEAWTSG